MKDVSRKKPQLFRVYILLFNYYYPNIDTFYSFRSSSSSASGAAVSDVWYLVTSVAVSGMPIPYFPFGISNVSILFLSTVFFCICCRTLQLLCLESVLEVFRISNLSILQMFRYHRYIYRDKRLHLYTFTSYPICFQTSGSSSTTPIPCSFKYLRISRIKISNYCLSDNRLLLLRAFAFLSNSHCMLSRADPRTFIHRNAHGALRDYGSICRTAKRQQYTCSNE